MPNSPARMIANALELQQEFVDAIQVDADGSAFSKVQEAIETFTEVQARSDITDEQRLFIRMALAKAHMCLGSGERRREHLELAAENYKTASGILDSAKDQVFAPKSPEGFWKRVSRLGRHEPDMDLVDEWNKTKGGLLMNLGVLERAGGRHESSLSAFNQAETLLFDHYVKQIGPLADIEAAARVINLWQNTMEAAMDTTSHERASEAVQNALKLSSFWAAHDLDLPESIANAVAALLKSICQLQPDQRSSLDSHLPKETTETIEFLTDGE